MLLKVNCIPFTPVLSKCHALMIGPPRTHVNTRCGRCVSETLKLASISLCSPLNMCLYLRHLPSLLFTPLSVGVWGWFSTGSVDSAIWSGTSCFWMSCNLDCIWRWVRGSGFDVRTAFPIHRVLSPASLAPSYGFSVP